MGKFYYNDYPVFNVAGRRGRRVSITLTETAYDHVSKGRWAEMVELNVCFPARYPLPGKEVHHIWEVEKSEIEAAASAVQKPFGQYTSKATVADAIVKMFPLEYTGNAYEFLTPKGFETAKKALYRAICDYAVRHGLCDTTAGWTGQY